jgi:DNA-directed RNA polymerase subunit RPC12/RpoP
MRVICHWCGRELKFDSKKGYVHSSGALYIQQCEKCGETFDIYPYPDRCPKCGGKLLDHHCALPRRVL